MGGFSLCPYCTGWSAFPFKQMLDPSAGTKHRIARDLVFYANATVGGEDAIAVAQREARQRANRESAYDLELATRNLPSWYRGWLHWRGEKPLEAPKSLVGLSNATSRDDAEKHVASTKRSAAYPDVPTLI